MSFIVFITFFISCSFHVSCLLEILKKISSHLMSCLHIPKMWIMGRNCIYIKVLSLYETVIYKLYCMVWPKRGHCNDQNRILVIDPKGATLSINYMLQHCYPYRHAYLSNYPIISRQSVLLCFLNNLSNIKTYIPHT